MPGRCSQMTDRQRLDRSRPYSLTAAMDELQQVLRPATELGRQAGPKIIARRSAPSTITDPVLRHPEPRIDSKMGICIPVPD